tara:strand:+ start:314 stop:529 length:216 start_codon:yes stop_codon:yes gene_type:complete
MRHVYEGAHEDEKEWFTIHEVYYNENGIADGWTKEPKAASATTENELRLTLELQLKCLDRPALEYGKEDDG